MSTLDEERCYRALVSRDPRFDGTFFVGVSTTGIYCRPICPARTPGRARCRFFANAASAERMGFRACLRCRPERSPGDASVDAAPQLVRAAVARITEGALDRGSVEALADELGVSARHLRRTVEEALGVTPIELALTRRVGLAKMLIADTALSMSEIAFASGFSSIRRFNAAFVERFGKPPSALRAHTREAEQGAFTITLEARPPFAGEHVLAFLAGRAIAGVEHVADGHYRRFVRIGASHGHIDVSLDDARPGIVARIELGLLPELTEIVARLRRVFDLDARPDLIDAHLARDEGLREQIARVPGLRVPGAFEPFEIAIRTILGQQVTVKAATTMSGRLAERFGERVAIGPADTALTSPTAARLADATIDEVAAIGLPRARAETIIGLSQGVVSGAIDFSRTADVERTLAALLAVRGVGPWTADYIAMRIFGEPDRFLASDLAVKKALGVTRAEDAETRSVKWRPWRAYASMHLWTSLSQGG